MYCANCGTALGPGLSYCNRCGFNLREKNESNTNVISAFLTAITVLGTVGLAIMLFGDRVATKSKPGSGADRRFHDVYVFNR